MGARLIPLMTNKKPRGEAGLSGGVNLEVLTPAA